MENTNDQPKPETPPRSPPSGGSVPWMVMCITVMCCLCFYGGYRSARPPKRDYVEKGLGEWAFRAGATVAGKLIWENPNPYFYTNTMQLQEAAWLYALPTIRVKP